MVVMLDGRAKCLFLALKTKDPVEEAEIVKERESIEKIFGPDNVTGEEAKEWEEAIRFLSKAKQDQYTVIIIAGHASKRRGLVFEKNRPDITVLANLIAQIESLQVLILNCCETELLGEEILKERKNQPFFDQENDHMVVFCWSTECNFEGARLMNEHFCQKIQRLNTVESIRDDLRRGGKLFREAFQQAIVQTAAGKGYDGVSQNCYTVGPYDQAAKRGHHYLGEPMLLPYLSTHCAHVQVMVAKYKVADAGIELIKRLKTIVRRGYLYGNPREDDFARITTLFSFGEFLAYFQMMREEDPTFYVHQIVRGVEFAFSGEYKHLRHYKDNNVEGLLLTRSIGQDQNCIMEATEPLDMVVDQLDDFATTVYPGLFTLYKMDIKAISEVMRNDPQNPHFVRTYADFSNQISLTAKEIAEVEDEGDKQELWELRDAFQKLDDDIKVMQFRPDTDLYESILHFKEEEEEKSIWEQGIVSYLYHKIVRYIVKKFNITPDMKLPLPLVPYPSTNPLYFRDKSRYGLHRGTNTYRRIAWIHDSVLDLVTALDPSINADMNDPKQQSYHPFHPFYRFDRDLCQENAFIYLPTNPTKTPPT